MSFTDNPELPYILVYIELQIADEMYKGHCVCDVLDYNTGTWRNCDDKTITQYPGYQMNVDNDLSIDKKQKGKKLFMDGSDRIVSMLYFRKGILALITYYFITGKSVSKYMEHIKERISDFGAFKEEARMIKITCSTIQTSISLRKEYLETVIENNERLCSSESKYYYWLSFDGLKPIISINPVEYLE